MQPTALPLAGTTTAKTPTIFPKLLADTGVTPEMAAVFSSPKFADVFSADNLQSTGEVAPPQVVEQEDVPLTEPQKITITDNEGEDPVVLRGTVEDVAPLPLPKSATPVQHATEGEVSTIRTGVVEAVVQAPIARTGQTTETSQADMRSAPLPNQAMSTSPVRVTDSLPGKIMTVPELPNQQKPPSNEMPLQSATKAVTLPAAVKPRAMMPPTPAADRVPIITAPYSETITSHVPSNRLSTPKPSANAAAQILPLIASKPLVVNGRETRDSTIGTPLEPFTLGRGDGPAALQPTGTTPMIQRNELTGHVARQIADVAHHLPARPVEITLSPEELGRVRLSVSTHENGIVLNIAAERPETADLLRRNIGQLGEQFESLGFENIAFSFSGGEEKQTDDDQSPTEPTNLPLLDETDTTPLQIALSTSGSAGVDLRL